MSVPYISVITTAPFTDATNTPVSGTLTVTPSSKFLKPGGGQGTSRSIQRNMVAGLLQGTLSLANPALCSPTIGYTFAFKDPDAVHQDPPFENVLIVPDSNGNFDLALLNTGQFVQNVPQTVISISGGQAADNQLLSLISGPQAVSAFTVAAIADGVAVTASSAIPSMQGAIVGLFTQSVQAGSSVQVQFTGLITYNGWAFTPGLPVFLSPTGVLTQTVPASGFLQAMGVADTPTSVVLAIQPPITIQ